jgi:hypothetical protein
MPLKPRAQKKWSMTITEPNRDKSIPAGFPKSIISPTAWTGANFNFEHDPSQERYRLTLNEAQIMELEQACHNFKGSLVRPCTEALTAHPFFDDG